MRLNGRWPFICKLHMYRPLEIIKWECSSQMLSLLLQKQRRHVKQQTQAWLRARHSEVTVAMLIGPPEPLRSCSPMLGETTPQNHSAVKKVVPKTRSLAMKSAWGLLRDKTCMVHIPLCAWAVSVTDAFPFELIGHNLSTIFARLTDIIKQLNSKLQFFSSMIWSKPNLKMIGEVVAPS